jgi:hypothetical protein
MTVMIIPAFAADDPFQIVENLSEFIFSLIRTIGLILLGFGILQLSLSLKSHDSSQRANGMLPIAGGIVITFTRENILLSERAFAYKMKLDAMKRQGYRTDLTLSQVGTKSRTDEIVAKGFGVSKSTVQRFIRLTKLLPPILQIVDEGRIALTPGAELSFLTQEEQENFEIFFATSTIAESGPPELPPRLRV